jgi:amidase
MRLALISTVAALLVSQPQQPRSATRYDIVEKSISEIADALRAGTTTSREITSAYLDRIAAFDRRGPAINAVIALNPRAADEAAARDRERAAGRVRGPLHGIPILIKDNYDTADLPTTAGAVALRGSRPDRDAFMVRRLREAGAVILGKTNLHEFARGITTISSLGGQTRNPYDPTRNPGGSSGGTGAAVAASFAAAGLGTDTCGSIRYPSAVNALVGLRPTLGATSRAGIIPLAHSQDVGGPIARSVRDVALLMDATAGRDPDDPATERSAGRLPPSYTQSLEARPLADARLGVLTALFGDGPDDAPAGTVVRTALREMESAGAELTPLDHAETPTEADGVAIIRFEFKFDLNDYLRKTPRAPVRSLSEILDKRLALAALEPAFRRSNDVESLDSDAYRAIVARNARLRDALIALMDAQHVTALVYPTLRRTAAKIGEPQAGGNCAAAAATGLPAITVPAGFADDGMPVGVELLGRPFSEPDLLALAYSYERLTHHRRPPALAPLRKESAAERGRR